MNRFIWLMRREIWEHKAIWVAPLIVIGCLLLAVFTGNVHLGPIGGIETGTPLGEFPEDKQVSLLLIVYAGLVLLADMVMGIVAFFYALDSLYADRRDRSVLFWKSMPLSDAETVLSKFTVAAVAIPLVALATALVAQLVVAGGGSVTLAMAGLEPGIMWRPEALLGGALVALLWSITAMLWFSPIIAYLMLASAWAPKGPFLWAVLPPVALAVAERVLLKTGYVGNFVAERLFGLYRLLGSQNDQSGETVTDEPVREGVMKITEVDIAGSLREFYTSPDLWLGLLAAALLLAAAMWVRRYRDENS